MWRSVCVLVLLLCLAAGGRAQVTTGRIQGAVTDAQNGVVPGVDIKVVNKLTGQEFATLTDENGSWVLPSMASGTYTVTVSLAGFKSVTIDNVKIDAGVPATVNAKLEVGQVT